MALSACLLLALCSQAAALLAPGGRAPMMLSRPMPASRTPISPAMGLFGGSGRARWIPFRPIKRVSGPGMCDGGDGGGSTSEPTPEPSDDDSSSNPLASMWKAYEAELEAKPLLMKALTSMIGFALGDILAQKFIQKADGFDWCGLA